jgi:hypothetical protein
MGYDGLNRKARNGRFRGILPAGPKTFSSKTGEYGISFTLPLYRYLLPKLPFFDIV